MYTPNSLTVPGALFPYYHYPENLPRKKHTREKVYQREKHFRCMQTYYISPALFLTSRESEIVKFCRCDVSSLPDKTSTATFYAETSIATSFDPAQLCKKIKL